MYMKCDKCGAGQQTCGRLEFNCSKCGSLLRDPRATENEKKIRSANAEKERILKEIMFWNHYSGEQVVRLVPGIWAVQGEHNMVHVVQAESADEAIKAVTEMIDLFYKRGWADCAVCQNQD